MEVIEIFGRKLTIEDRKLLLVDLSARLPYDVVVRCYFVDGGGEEVLDTDDIADLLYNEENSEFPMYKPYLRPMSSMTEEERKWFQSLPFPYDFVDGLNKNMFDYRGLIEKGLAIEVTKDNNPYK